MVVPQKTERITIFSHNSTSGYVPLKYWKYGLKEMQHHSQSLKYVRRCSSKNEWYTKCGPSIQWNKKGRKFFNTLQHAWTLRASCSLESANHEWHILYDSTYRRYGVTSQWWLQGLGGGVWVTVSVMGLEYDGCATMWMYLIPLKMVNFMCI